ncbi:MAG TPA: prenyltransferase/squalene oxidase repeat-containing protein [Gemmataceae bacterium]|nr:prenyltransferase/squalene oxidase repeat-containing protein [Gemmataceae bacterium]
MTENRRHSARPNRRDFLTAAAAGTALAAGLSWVPAVPAAEETGKESRESQQWNRMVEKAITYLRGTQADDGTWSRNKAPGVTGVVLTGLLQTGKVSPNDPMADKALKHIESLIDPKTGGIAGKENIHLQNYVTSINVMALTAANRDSYKQVIGDGVKFLKKLQWDEEEGKSPEDNFYGGAGYDSKSRPDLSNTQFFLDAMKAAGVPKDDPALKKALVFVSRCQNLKGEHNDQKWAGKVNDGSFIYSAAGDGLTKVVDQPLPDGALPGYGSMTYAGIKSLIYAGVTKDDPRVQKAYQWIQQHYAVDRNPGMPDIRSQWGLYYYYHTMAKCLDILGVDEVVDAQGKKHDWRGDLIEALAKRQRPDGSWVNPNDHWREGDPNLVTGYVLMALAHCRPRK